MQLSTSYRSQRQLEEIEGIKMPKLVIHPYDVRWAGVRFGSGVHALLGYQGWRDLGIQRCWSSSHCSVRAGEGEARSSRAMQNAMHLVTLQVETFALSSSHPTHPPSRHPQHSQLLPPKGLLLVGIHPGDRAGDHGG